MPKRCGRPPRSRSRRALHGQLAVALRGTGNAAGPLWPAPAVRVRWPINRLTVDAGHAFIRCAVPHGTGMAKSGSRSPMASYFVTPSVVSR